MITARGERAVVRLPDGTLPCFASPTPAITHRAIVDLGADEEFAREAAIVLGQSLPEGDSGMVVI